MPIGVVSAYNAEKNVASITPYNKGQEVEFKPSESIVDTMDGKLKVGDRVRYFESTLLPKKDSFSKRERTPFVVSTNVSQKEVFDTLKDFKFQSTIKKNQQLNGESRTFIDNGKGSFTFKEEKSNSKFKKLFSK